LEGCVTGPRVPLVGRVHDRSSTPQSPSAARILPLGWEALSSAYRQGPRQIQRCPISQRRSDHSFGMGGTEFRRAFRCQPPRRWKSAKHTASSYCIGHLNSNGTALVLS
jgi:hypothetical protein